MLATITIRPIIIDVGYFLKSWDKQRRTLSIVAGGFDILPLRRLAIKLHLPSNIIRLLTIFLAICGLGLSQDFRATISGQVTDPSGSAIPNATIRITNNATNELKQVTTNSSGAYTVPYLNPGDYTVQITAHGFETAKRTNVVLRVAQTLNLPVKLTVGQMSQQVTVTAQQNTVDTANADRGLVFDPVKTQQYPLNGRQEYMLLALTPGVLFTQEQFGASGFSGTRGWDANNSYKINGGRPGTSIFLLNGAPINDYGGTWEISPNIESVQEFKVMTNVYDAEYGRMAGGVVNTTIKSGTNQWHGDAFDYWRNSIMDANTIQNNAIGRGRGRHNQHQFGGVVGGPIRKNKDFIFGSFEGWREVVPFPTVSNTVPNFLRSGENFGQYKIYDPMTTHPCVGSVCQGSAYIRDPFPGNVIPLSRISPIGQKILSYYPAANSNNPNALTQNYIAASNEGRYQYNQPMFRWDHVFNENDKLYTLAGFFHGTEYRNSSGFPAPAGSGDINSARTTQVYVADWTHVISPTTVLDVRGSFDRYTQFFPRHTDYNFLASDLGISQMFSAPTAGQNVAPVVNLSSYTQLFGLYNSDSFGFSTYNQYDFSPSITMVRGKHTIHTGFEFIYAALGQNNTGQNYGQLNFDQSWTQQLSDKSQGQFDGSSVADLLLGYPTGSNTRVDNNAAFYRTRPYYAGYIQDNWKVKPHFTIDMGIRYDVQVPWKERYNQLNSGFDFNAVNPYSDQIIANWKNIAAQYNAAHPNDPYGGYPAPPAQILGGLRFAGKNGRSQRAYAIDWTNVQPRIGFAWQVGPQTVLRWGGGLYYQQPPQENTTYGFQQSTPYIASLDGIHPSAGFNQTGPYSLNQPFPGGVAPVPGSSLGLATNVGNTVSFDDYNYRIPRTWEYSFGIQQGLPYGMIADLAYTGNYSLYEPASFNEGYLPYNTFLQGQADPTYLNRTLPNPFYGILPSNSSLGGSQQIGAHSLLNAYPEFNGGVTNNLGQWGYYRYDALSLQLEKRLNSQSKGNFTWVVSYTFSKAFEANHRMDNWNAFSPLVHELDYQDKPQSIAFSGVWDLPFGKGRTYASDVGNPIVNGLISNWTFDWIFTYSSGYPTSWPDLVLNTSIPGCGSWSVADQNSQHWFNNNKACYSTRAPYTFHTNPDRFPNIRNPSAPQVNIAFEKSFPFSERYKLTFRGEAFNIGNTVIRAAPDTNFNDANFGQLPLAQQNFPRLVQLAAKFYF